MKDLHAEALSIAAQDAKIAELQKKIEILEFRDRVFTDEAGSVGGGKTMAEIYRDQANAAEAKLRELCEMEPVAWMNPGNGHTFDHNGRDRMIENGKHGGEFAIAARLAQQFSIPVIPRPTMPESGK